MISDGGFPRIQLQSGLIFEAAGGFENRDAGIFCCRIGAMINLQHPLAVLPTRMPWAQIDAVPAAQFEHLDRGSVKLSMAPPRPGSHLVGQDSCLTLCTPPVIIAARAYPKLQMQRHPSPL